MDVQAVSKHVAITIALTVASKRLISRSRSGQGEPKDASLAYLTVYAYLAA